MSTHEAALCDLLARYQPELAPRLARRLVSELPSLHVEALLAEGASEHLTPRLRQVIDAALAEELGDGGLLESSQTTAPRREAPRVLEGTSVPRVPPKEEAAKEALLLRVASLQPEMAPNIARLIEQGGPTLVQKCMESDAILQQHVQKALKQLFTEEDTGPEPATSSLFSQGRGHVLPGARPTAVSGSSTTPVSQGRSIRSSATTTVASSRALRAGNELQRPMIAPCASEAAPLDDPWGGYSAPEANAPPASASRGSPGPSQGRIWGLQEFLSELGLSEYEDAVLKWATDMGAIFLEELVENAQDLGEAMDLKPLERKRLERHGPQAMRQIVSQRPRAKAQQVASAPAAPKSETPAAPAPEQLPTKLFGKPR